jgi:hypothetical protein
MGRLVLSAWLSASVGVELAMVVIAWGTRADSGTAQFLDTVLAGTRLLCLRRHVLLLDSVFVMCTPAGVAWLDCSVLVPSWLAWRLRRLPTLGFALCSCSGLHPLLLSIVQLGVHR